MSTVARVKATVSRPAPSASKPAAKPAAKAGAASASSAKAVLGADTFKATSRRPSTPLYDPTTGDTTHTSEAGNLVVDTPDGGEYVYTQDGRVITERRPGDYSPSYNAPSVYAPGSDPFSPYNDPFGGYNSNPYGSYNSDPYGSYGSDPYAPPSIDPYAPSSDYGFGF